MKHVKHYEATVYHASTGSSSTRKYPFTQVQANEVGGLIEKAGLNIVLASKLCSQWTKRGQRGDIRYSYTLCVEELLR